MLRSGFWRDAAYVAERVMNTDELRAYVRGNFPAAPPVASPSPNLFPETDAPANVQTIQAAISQDSSTNPAAYALRYLLARRLARDGRCAEARPYYPAPLWPNFDQYVAALKLGRNDRQPKSARADALWRAAKIERWLGMELFGTEDDPDWFVVDGQFDEDHYHALSVRLRDPATEGDSLPPPSTYVPPVSADEKRRVSSHPVHPEERFHYRQLAADLAWQAAALMGDQQEETARVLANGGHWLESVGEDRAADRFYLALLRRCNRTALGQQADKAGALPEVA